MSNKGRSPSVTKQLDFLKVSELGFKTLGPNGFRSTRVRDIKESILNNQGPEYVTHSSQGGEVQNSASKLDPIYSRIPDVDLVLSEKQSKLFLDL